MTKHYIIPLFVPHYGCPHDCVFCNQKKITGLETDITEAQVEKIIDEHLATFRKDSFIEVAFYGGSFTAIELEIQRKLLSIPLKYKEEGKINGIRLSTRPDAIDDVVLTMLKESLVDTIELGVQSLDPVVLKLSERGHSSEDVFISSKMIKDMGFRLGLQLMTGLPGDSYHKSIESAKKILSLKPDFIRVYPTLVIKGTNLEKMYLGGSYKPQNLEEAIETACDILMLADAMDIRVIRIGLQPTDNIQEGKDVVGGPFHPSIRQLVESRLLYKLLKKVAETERLPSAKDWIIYCSKGYSSIISGQKGSNRDAIGKLLNSNRLKILEEDLPENRIRLVADEFIKEIDLKLLKIEEAHNIK